MPIALSLGMMILKKKRAKTMPTALHRDDESSNPGSKQEIVLRVE